MSDFSSEQSGDIGPGIDEAATRIQEAILIQLSEKIAIVQPPSSRHSWWERPAIPLLFAAILGGVGPVVTAISRRNTEKATHRNTIQVTAQNRRLEYMRTVMAAPTPERRLELLTLIAAAPESDAIDRDWANAEQSRVLNRYAEAEKNIAEAEENVVVAKREAEAALSAAGIANEEAATQRRLREEAELVSESTQAQLDKMRENEAKAFDVLVAANERLTAASDETRQAEITLKLTSLESQRRMAGPRVPNVPMGFSLNIGKCLVGGTCGSVLELVTWSDTPQGVDFWSQEHGRFEKGQGLSELALYIVGNWIEAVEAFMPSQPGQPHINAFR